ncbi:MAG: MFS transporter [Rhodobacteraceae bacterium]|nr:MFS transporter [Paracoccaceae bacterium]
MPGFSSVWPHIRGAPLTIFLVCLASWTLTNLDQSLFGYAIPGFRTEFDIGLEVIGWILSVSFAVGAVAAVAIGVLADRIGRRIMLIVTLGGSALLVGVQAFAPGIWTLAFLRLLSFGMSNGVNTIVTTYTSEAAPARYRGLMTGFLAIGYPAGWFIASLGAAPLMAAYGWRATFLLAFIVVPLVALLFRWLPESKKFESIKAAAKPATPWFTQLRALFVPGLRRRTILCLLVTFFFGGAYASTAFYFPTFYTEVRDYSEADATLIVGLSYGLGLVGYIAAAVVGEFVMTRRNTLIVWYLVGSGALLGLIWLPNSYAADIFWFGFMATFSYGSNAVLGTWITELFPTEVRATGGAFAGTGGLYLGFSVFPVVTSYVVAAVGWQWAFTLVAVPLGVLAALVMLTTENFKSGIDLDEAAGTLPPAAP